MSESGPIALQARWLPVVAMAGGLLAFVFALESFHSAGELRSGFLLLKVGTVSLSSPAYGAAGKLTPIEPARDLIRRSALSDFREAVIARAAPLESPGSAELFQSTWRVTQTETRWQLRLQASAASDADLERLLTAAADLLIDDHAELRARTRAEIEGQIAALREERSRLQRVENAFNRQLFREELQGTSPADLAAEQALRLLAAKAFVEHVLARDQFLADRVAALEQSMAQEEETSIVQRPILLGSSARSNALAIVLSGAGLLLCGGGVLAFAMIRPRRMALGRR